MSFRDRVVERHPQAFAVEVPPVVRSAPTAVLHPGYWIVYANSRVGSEELARGMTEDQVWEGAALSLEKVDLGVMSG